MTGIQLRTLHMIPTMCNMERASRLRGGVVEGVDTVAGEGGPKAPQPEVEANTHKATSLQSPPEVEAR